MSQFLLIFLVLLSGWLPMSWAVGDPTVAMPGAEEQTAATVKPDSTLCDKPKAPTDERGGQEVKSAKAAQEKCELTKLEATTAPDAAMKNFNRDRLENVNTVGVEQGRILGQQGKVGEQAYQQWFEQADVTQRTENAYNKALRQGMQQGKQDLQKPQFRYQQAAAQLGAAGQHFSAADKTKLEAMAQRQVPQGEVDETAKGWGTTGTAAQYRQGALAAGNVDKPFNQAAYTAFAAQSQKLEEQRMALSVAQKPGVTRGVVGAEAKNSASGFTNLADARQRTEQALSQPRLAQATITDMARGKTGAPTQGSYFAEAGQAKGLATVRVATNPGRGTMTAQQVAELQNGAAVPKRMDSGFTNLADARQRTEQALRQPRLAQATITDMDRGKTGAPTQGPYFAEKEPARMPTRDRSLPAAEVKQALAQPTTYNTFGADARDTKHYDPPADIVASDGSVMKWGLVESFLQKAEEHGYSRQVAAGIAGRLHIESRVFGGNQWKIEDDGRAVRVTNNGVVAIGDTNLANHAYGIGQWRLDRAEGLKSALGVPELTRANMEGTLNKQVDYLFAEDLPKQTRYFKQLRGLQNEDSSAVEAAEIFTKYSMRPAKRTGQAFGREGGNATVEYARAIDTMMNGRETPVLARGWRGNPVAARAVAADEGVPAATRRNETPAATRLAERGVDNQVLLSLLRGQSVQQNDAGAGVSWNALFGGKRQQAQQNAGSDVAPATGAMNRVVATEQAWIEPAQELRALDYLLLTGNIPLTPDEPLLQAGTDALTAAQCEAAVSDCEVR